MTKNNNQPMGFEALWEASEAIAAPMYAQQSSEELTKELIDLFDNYKQLDQNTKMPKDVITSLKKHCIGQLLFIITALSGRDGINVYASLLEEMKLNQI
jgi:hypothetical protein